MNRILKHTNESGRSMVEMLGVLAIVGVLSIGGIAGYSKAMAKFKVNKTLDQISMIITNVRTTFGNQSSYDGLNNANAIAYEIVGNDINQDGTLKNAFNGNVLINAVCEDGTYCPEFIIVYSGLEKSACATIASSDWGGSAASGLVSMTIGATGEDGAIEAEGIEGEEYTWEDDTLPIAYKDAFTACEGADAIQWKYN